jgi:hypothetical protein
MEAKNKKTELVLVKAPTEGLLEYYQKLYTRNQTKFIRRASLEASHLGTEFEFDGKKLTLMGSVDALLMLVKDSEDKYYRMNCNLISEIIVGKP